MSTVDKVEMAPLANTAEVETNLLHDGITNENVIDDGLVEPRRRAVNNGSGNGYSTHKPENVHPIYPKPVSHTPMDVNKYATKKTVAQGLMDLALLTANANQLRYVLESGSTGPYFVLSVTLISLSILLQLVIGIVLIFLGRYNITDKEEARRSERLNNWVIAIIFFITALNVLISAFGINTVERIDPMLIVDATLQSLRLQHFESTTASGS